jgi:hypothetical protein
VDAARTSSSGFTANDWLSGGQGADTVGNAAEAGDDVLLGTMRRRHRRRVPELTASTVVPGTDALHERRTGSALSIAR